MDKELIERLARECGFTSWPEWPEYADAWERFAALIAEECAKAVEDINAFDADDPGATAADAIREHFRL